MRNLLLCVVTIFLFASLMTSCHSGYKQENGKIYYKWVHGGNWTMEQTPVEGADVASFETIENNLNIHLGKDKNHVFIASSILNHADPLTFEQIREYYWKDKNHVYLLQFGGTDCKIENADSKTFGVINDYLWAKDKNHVYYKFDRLEDVNPNRFVAIDEEWGKDDKYYYWNNLRVDSIEAKSAEIVSPYYIKDKNYVFFKNTIVRDANPATFKADGVGSFGHDDKYVQLG